jgi:serine/threonine-protein phosphatase 4 regulatory subunit 1
MEMYIGMAKFDKESEFGDSDYVQFCAFNFPAVLLTMGPESWPALSETFAALAKDFQWKTRRTLSFSLHEIANILGPKMTEEQLLPTFDLFLHDLDEVKLGVITHFADFLKVIAAAKRKEFLPVLHEIQHSPVNWRFRKLIARQIGQLAQLFEIDVSQKEIVPFAVALLCDGVASVRRNCQLGLGALIHTLAISPEKQSEFLQKLKEFAEDKSYQKRISFAQMSERLAESVTNEVWNGFFLESLVNLGKDKVPNIRIVTARTVVSILKREPFSSDERLRTALLQLQKDAERDVVLAAGGSDPGRKAPSK